MNSRLSLQQFKGLFFVQSLFALLLAAPGVASANSINIKDTNYPIPSNAYFVSPDGKDTNSGTQAWPWSVAKALKSAPEGSTIVFRGGTYRNVNNAYICKKLTLQPYPHEKAWLKGSDVVTDWVSQGSIWRKDGWTYSFPSNVGSEAIDPNYPMAGHGDMVYIDGVSLKQVGSKAEMGPGKFFVDSANKQLYIGNNPAGKTVEATTRKRAFATGKCNSSDPSSPSGTVIRGLGLEHFADMAITVGIDNVTLENNTIVWNGQQGVHFLGESNGQKDISTYGKVRGNTFSYNGRKGLGGDRAHHMLVEDNTISYNNIERFSKSWDAAGLKVARTKGAILRKNLVEHNLAHGMWTDVSSTNSTIVNNTVRYNHGFGIYAELSHKGIIAANVAYNNSTGIALSNSSSLRVYNNTLANNGTNLRIKDDPRVNSNTVEYNAGLTWITKDNVVKNNILSNTTSKELLVSDILCGKTITAEQLPNADYNAYYRTSSTPQNVINWAVGTGACRFYTSIAAFNSATGFEVHALAVDNNSTNPFFINEASGDYRLKTGSKAIGHGEPLPADVAQAIGLPAGVKVDLGAVQSTVY